MSLLHFCEAKQQGSVQNVSVLASMSSRLHNVQGFLVKKTAHLPFCIKVRQFYSDLRCKYGSEWYMSIYVACISHICIMELIKRELLPSSSERKAKVCNKLQFIYFFLGWFPKIKQAHSLSGLHEPATNEDIKQSSSFGRIPLHRREGTVFVGVLNVPE